MHVQVLHRHGRRQVGLQRLPALSAVLADIHAEVGAAVQYALALRVLAHNIDGCGRQVAGDRLPGVAHVARAEDIRPVVVLAAVAQRHIHGGRLVLRRHDTRHMRVLREALRDAHPGTSLAVAAPDHPVVGADVEQSLALRRFVDRRDGLVVDGIGRTAHARLVVAREVVGEAVPGVAAVRRTEKVLEAVVDGLGVVRRDHRVGKPFAAVHFLVVGLLRIDVLRSRRVGQPQVAAHETTVEAAGIDDIGVGRIDGDDGALAPGGGGPTLRPVVGTPVGEGRAAHVAALVLHGAEDLVGRPPVIGHIVELCGGDLAEEVLPHPASVVADDDAAVIPIEKVVGIGRVYPQRVVVAMHALAALVLAAHHLEGLAAVLRPRHGHAHDVHDVLVLRVDADLSEHPSVGTGEAFELVVLGADARPVAALVVAAVDLHAVGHHLDGASVGVEFVGLRLPLGGVVVHGGIDDVGVAAGEGQSDAAGELRLGQTGVGDLPGVATVPRPVDMVAVLGHGVAPAPADTVPCRCQQRVGVGGVHGDVDGAGMVVVAEDLLPGLAAVDGPVHAAVGVVAPLMPAGGGIGDVGIGGMDDDAGEGGGVGEAGMLPGRTAVGRLVDAEARQRGAEDIGLTGAEVDDVGIGGGDGEASNRLCGLTVEEGRPVLAGIGRLPEAARREGGVHDVPIAGNAGHFGAAAADDVGSGIAPGERPVGRGLAELAVLVEGAQAEFAVGGDVLGRRRRGGVE